jgi:glycosyltransferase involved in cell wall biosynthesis
MKKMHRIMHLQTGAAISGGVAGYIASLVNASALSGFYFSVTANISEKSELEKLRKYGDVAICEISLTYGLFGLPLVLLNMRKLLLKENIAIVHSHALRAGFICAVLNLIIGTRFVHTNHGLRFQQKPNRFQSLLFQYLEYFVISRAERVFCIRRCDSDLLKIIIPKYSKKIETIVSRIDPISILNQKKIVDKPKLPTLIGIGSLIEVKRVDRFIDWLAALSVAGMQYRAVWLGDGPLRPLLENQAKNASVEIIWFGHVDAFKVAAEIAKADVMLLTSEFEVLPLAVLEVMAKSKPVIATDFFGVRDFVQDKLNGIIIPSNFKPPQAAEKIATLLADKKLCYEMGRKSKEIFLERFSGANRMALEYYAYYKNILNMD